MRAILLILLLAPSASALGLAFLDEDWDDPSPLWSLGEGASVDCRGDCHLRLSHRGDPFAPSPTATHPLPGTPFATLAATFAFGASPGKTLVFVDDVVRFVAYEDRVVFQCGAGGGYAPGSLPAGAPYRVEVVLGPKACTLRATDASGAVLVAIDAEAPLPTPLRTVTLASGGELATWDDVQVDVP